MFQIQSFLIKRANFLYHYIIGSGLLIVNSFFISFKVILCFGNNVLNDLVTFSILSAFKFIVRWLEFASLKILFILV